MKDIERGTKNTKKHIKETKKWYEEQQKQSLSLWNFELPRFIRHHHPVPSIDPKQYRLCVDGIGTKSVTLCLEDLKSRFVKREAHCVFKTVGQHHWHANMNKSFVKICKQKSEKDCNILYCGISIESTLACDSRV